MPKPLALVATSDHLSATHPQLGTSPLGPLGLGYGPLMPLHFTIDHDLHLAIPGIYLHRTLRMPPVDADGVSVAAAFVGAASHLRLIDLVKIGDWLRHRELLDLTLLVALATADPWRPGAAAALAVIPHLDSRSRSVKESETRIVLEFAGLPKLEVNRDLIDRNGNFLGCVDLLYEKWRLIAQGYDGPAPVFGTDWASLFAPPKPLRPPH